MSKSISTGNRVSLKYTGKKIVRYDEFTGEPYEVDDAFLVYDNNGYIEQVLVINKSKFEFNKSKAIKDHIKSMKKKPTKNPLSSGRKPVVIKYKKGKK